MSFCSSASIPRFPRIALVLVALAALAGADRAWAAVTSVRAPHNSFSPNADGVRDSAVVTWTLSADAESVNVEVRRAGEADVVHPLRTFALGPRPAGPDSIAWDGRNDGGVLQPDLLYSLRVVEKNTAGQVLSSGSATIVLDTTPPSLPRFDPDFDGFDTTDSILAIGGIAAGAEFVVVMDNGLPRDTITIAGGDSVFTGTIRLSEGLNALALRSEDRAGNASPLSVASNATYRNTATVSDFRALPSRFSPNGDGVHDSILVSLRLDAATTRLEAQIRKSEPPGSATADSVPFVRLYDGPAAAGAHEFAWLGLDSTGAPAPQGTYFVFVRAESSTVAGDPAIGRPRTLRVELDLAAPSPPVLTETLPSRSTHSVAHLVGFVTGGDSVRVYRNGARVAQGPANFDLVVTMQRGSNSFTLEGVDAAGNVSAPAGPFVVIYDELAGFHAPERFRSGDVFEVNLASSPREIRIELFATDGRKHRTLVSTSSNTSQELAWNLLDELGRTVGDGPVIARLTVTYANGRVDQTKAAVVVAK